MTAGSILHFDKGFFFFYKSNFNINSQFILKLLFMICLHKHILNINFIVLYMGGSQVKIECCPPATWRKGLFWLKLMYFIHLCNDFRFI